jgi:hypothetical protein
MATTPGRPRALDWMCAAMIFGWGVTLLLPGETLTSSPAYLELLDRFPESVWGVILLGIGLLRFAALLINGHWRPSPLLRGAAALLGAIVWGQFLLGFLATSLIMGVVSAGVAVNAVMLIADLYSTARAGADYVRGQHSHAAIHHR